MRLTDRTLKRAGVFKRIEEEEGEPVSRRTTTGLGIAIMRAPPAQLAIHHLCGNVPDIHLPTRSMSEQIREGHDMLVQLSGKDFGYDLQAWHDHLKESRDGGYTYGWNITLPKIMKAAMASTAWQEAVQTIEGRQARRTANRKSK